MRRAVALLERGRAPAYVALATAIALAGFTALRFLVLVRVLPADDYGLLNIFTQLANLLPLFASLGLTPQIQRIARHAGRGSVGSLVRTGLVVSAATVVPNIAIVVILARPLDISDDILGTASAVGLIALGTVLATHASQVMLGLNYRSMASLTMFAVNAAGTAGVCGALAFGTLSVVSILCLWGGASMVVGVVALIAVSRIRTEQLQTGRLVSFREGFASLPSLVGPWLLPFVARYLMGVAVGTAELASFAVIATVADMAFLIAASVFTYYSNDVMTRRTSPWRSFAVSSCLYMLMVIPGLFGLWWIVPRYASEGYELSLPTAFIVAGTGLARLHFSAWRPRAVGDRKLYVSSWSFMTSTAIVTLAIVLLRPEAPEWFAAAILIAYTVVAAVQFASVRGPAAIHLMRDNN